MKEITEFIKSAGCFYLGTVDGDQPEVRPIGVLQEYDERGVGSILHDLTMVHSTPYGTSINELPFQVYTATSRLVQTLVAKGPCIFLGRCTARILSTEAHVPFVHAFIYASNMEDRIERARTVDHVEASRIEAYIRRKDSQRKNYNRFFTDKAWGDPRSYDLMLNTSALGYEAATEAILGVLRAKEDGGIS